MAVPPSRAVRPRSDAFDAAGYDDVVPIGFGGAATVYRARQLEFDRLVAVKVLTLADPAVLRRFEREKRILGRLSGYPSIAQVFDAGVTAGGAPYLVMQFHPGGSLSDLIRRGGPQPLSRVLPIGVQLAATLDAAHALGVLHRDIKPGNVMLDVMQQPVLTDFGISALATLSRENTAALTYHFAAPEVVNDPTGASSASDQYGLALTLWALLLGRGPWDDLAARRLAELPAEVPAGVVEVLQRALAPAPGDRFASCLSFAEALRAAQVGSGLPATAIPGLPADPDGRAEEDPLDSDAATADPSLAADPQPLRSVRRRPVARTVSIVMAGIVAVGFASGAAVALIDSPRSAPAAIPLAAPTGVAAVVEGSAVVVTWDDTNGGRLPYFVYRTGSGEAAVTTDPGARTASFPLLPTGAGMCFRVGVLDAAEAATSDEVCAVVE